MDTRKKIKVLIVEDEAITAMAIKRNLEELGYSVPAIADTGEEAISLADKIKPNLILMDIVLKGKMDGTEAAERISNSHQIPIIFLTAYNDMDTINRAKTSAPYAYLSKPIDERHLDITVDFVLL
jgi:CheY-like chemotaxis protein